MSNLRPSRTGQSENTQECEIKRLKVFIKRVLVLQFLKMFPSSSKVPQQQQKQNVSTHNRISSVAGEIQIRPVCPPQNIHSSQISDFIWVKLFM